MKGLDKYYENPTNENRKQAIEDIEKEYIEEYKAVIELSKNVSLKSIILIASALQWDYENYCTTKEYKLYPATKNDLGVDTRMKLDTDNRKFISSIKKALDK